MKNNKEIIALIPAAGVGARMGKGMAKQYLPLNGKTILERSIEVFLDKPEIGKVIVAVAPDDENIKALGCFSHPKIHWVIGGETRAESVLNGLKAIDTPENKWVLVHDAARPCVRWDDILRLLSIKNEQGAILAVPVVDTLKKQHATKNGENYAISNTVDRQGLWQAQTPQFFPVYALTQALDEALYEGKNITDEASAMELAGFSPELVEGSKTNLKITYPEDLELAEFYLSQQQEK